MTMPWLRGKLAPEHDFYANLFAAPWHDIVAGLR
jgi:hypothetical protein